MNRSTKPGGYMKYAICFTAMLAGCVSMPGTVSEETATFDGAKVISVEPANAGTMGPAIGASWKSTAPDYVQIIAEHLGGYEAITGLAFNADGRIIRLDASGYPTRHKASRGPGTMVFRSSTQHFVMRMEDFKALLSAKSLKLRMDTLSGYADSDMTGSGALDGLRTLAAKLP